MVEGSAAAVAAAAAEAEEAVVEEGEWEQVELVLVLQGEQEEQGGTDHLQYRSVCADSGVTSVFCRAAEMYDTVL